MQIQAADYPLQVEPAQVLGFDCGLGAGLRICIFFGNKTHVGASFISLAPTFFKSQSALMPLLLLSKAQPLALGCDLVRVRIRRLQHISCRDIPDWGKRIALAPLF